MSRKEKLLQRFLKKPLDFTYNELQRLLNYFGYEEAKTGKTSGSRIAMIHHDNQHIIRLHRPHPGNEMRRYQLDIVEVELKKIGAIQ